MQCMKKEEKGRGRKKEKKIGPFVWWNDAINMKLACFCFNMNSLRTYSPVLQYRAMEHFSVFDPVLLTGGSSWVKITVIFPTLESSQSARYGQKQHSEYEAIH